MQVKIPFNNFINLDSDEESPLAGSYQYAENIIIDKDYSKLVSEKGTQLIKSLPDNSKIVGYTNITTDINSVIIYTKGSSSSDIYIYDNITGKVERLPLPVDLNFSNQVIGTFYVNRLNHTILVFTDGENEIRKYNLTKKEEVINKDELNLFRGFINKYPKVVKQTLLSEGGTLLSGSYHLGFSFSDNEFNPTSIIQLTNPIFISSNTNNENSKAFDGSSFGLQTSKSIDLSIVDIEDTYVFINIYLVRFEDSALIDVKKLTNVPIIDNTVNLVLTGSENFEISSLDEFLINNAVYNKVKGVLAYDNNLFLYNASKPTIDIGYQKYANNIKVKFVDKPISVNANKDSLFHNNLSFQSGDVVALYISFLLTNGSETFAYHISGRKALVQEGSIPISERKIEIKLEGLAPIAKSKSTFNIFQLWNSSIVSSPFQVGTPPNINIPITIAIIDSNNVILDFRIMNINSNSNNRTVMDIVVSNIDAMSINTGYKVGGVSYTRTGNIEGALFIESLNGGTAFDGARIGLLDDINSFYLAKKHSVVTETINDQNWKVSSEFTQTLITTPLPTDLVFQKLDGTFDEYGQQQISDTYTFTINTITEGMQLSLLKPVIIGLLNDSIDITNNFIIVENPESIDLKPKVPQNSFAWNVFFTIDYNMSIDDSSMILLDIDSNISNEYEDVTVEDVSDLGNIGNNGQDIKNFHLYGGRHSELNSGFWENKNEFYPDIDSFDVYDVDENNNGFKIGDIRNERVRHHRVPDFIKMPFYSNNNRRAIGLVLQDIKIPNELVNVVKGIRIYKAEKTEADSLVLGYGLSFNAEKGTTSFDSKTQSKANALPYKQNRFPEPKVIQFYNFSMLRNKSALSTASFLEYISKIEYNDSTTETKPNNFNYVEKKFFNTDPLNYSESNFIFNRNIGTKSIKGISYIDNNTEITNLTNQGFSGDFYNKYGESKILIETHSELLQKGYYLTVLKSYKDNVYFGFATRKLSGNPTVDLDIDNFIPSKSNINNRVKYNTLPIFSLGGTYINNVTFRLTDRSFGDGKGSDDEQVSLITYVTQEKDNISMRSSDSGLEQRYYPKDDREKVMFIDTSKMPNANESLVSDDPNGLTFDNYIKLYNDYNVKGILKNTIPKPISLVNTLENPFILARSKDSKTGLLISTFLENDFLTVPTKYGSIQRIEKYKGNLIIHCTKGFYITRGNRQLEIHNDFRAFLGDGNIIENKPVSIYEIDSGYAGCTSFYSAIKTKFGYIFVDYEDGKIFNFSESLEEISSFGTYKFFRDNLTKHSLLKKDNVNLSNEDLRNIMGLPFIGYDPENDRILVNFKNIKPTLLFNLAVLVDYDPVSFKQEDVGKIRFNPNIYKYEKATSLAWEVIPFTDENYFELKYFTISYYPEIKKWVSFHSYKPELFINSQNKMLSYDKSNIYKHNEFSSNIFYDLPTSIKSKFIQSAKVSDNNTILNSVNLLSYRRDLNNNLIINKGFDTILFENSYQKSKLFDLNNNNLYNNDWIYTYKNKTVFSLIRDILESDEFNRDSLIDKYIKFTLEYTNNNSEQVIYLGTTLDIEGEIQ